MDLVGFIPVHPRGCLVHLGSLSSFGGVVGVDRYIRVRWVPSPFGLVGSFGCAQGVVRFICVDWVYSFVFFRSSAYICVLRVHSGARPECR